MNYEGLYDEELAFELAKNLSANNLEKHILKDDFFIQKIETSYNNGKFKTKTILVKIIFAGMMFFEMIASILKYMKILKLQFSNDLIIKITANELKKLAEITDDTFFDIEEHEKNLNTLLARLTMLKIEFHLGIFISEKYHILHENYKTFGNEKGKIVIKILIYGDYFNKYCIIDGIEQEQEITFSNKCLFIAISDGLKLKGGQSIAPLKLMELAKFNEPFNVFDSFDPINDQCIPKLIRELPSIKLQIHYGVISNKTLSCSPIANIVYGNGDINIRILRFGDHFEYITTSENCFIGEFDELKIQKLVEDQTILLEKYRK